MRPPALIEVIRKGPTARIVIDGAELPFPVSRDSVTVPVHPDERPTVQLSLYADRVHVINQATADEEESRS